MLLREGDVGAAVELLIMDETTRLEAWNLRMTTSVEGPPTRAPPAGVPVSWYGHCKHNLLVHSAIYAAEHTIPVVVGYVKDEGRYRMLSITWEPAADAEPLRL